MRWSLISLSDHWKTVLQVSIKLLIKSNFYTFIDYPPDWKEFSPITTESFMSHIWHPFLPSFHFMVVIFNPTKIFADLLFSVWKKGQQDKKNQAAKKKADKKSDGSEKGSNSTEVIEIE